MDVRCLSPVLGMTLFTAKNQEPSPACSCPHGFISAFWLCPCRCPFTAWIPRMSSAAWASSSTLRPQHHLGGGEGSVTVSFCSGWKAPPARPGARAAPSDPSQPSQEALRAHSSAPPANAHPLAHLPKWGAGLWTPSTQGRDDHLSGTEGTTLMLGHLFITMFLCLLLCLLLYYYVFLKQILGCSLVYI